MEDINKEVTLINISGPVSEFINDYNNIYFDKQNIESFLGEAYYLFEILKEAYKIDIQVLYAIYKENPLVKITFGEWQIAFDNKRILQVAGGLKSPDIKEYFEGFEEIEVKFSENYQKVSRHLSERILRLVG